jgi:23S rRNA pseudouridine2605 synthase
VILSADTSNVPRNNDVYILECDEDTMTQSTGKTIRLNKVLAQAGVCSRRRADELIAAGKVSVDGTVVTELGTRIDPERSRLAVDGTPVQLRRPDDAPLYLALNKPVHVLTTAADPQGRRTVLDLLSDAVRDRRPFPVGRLDYLSEGLLLLTTDGELAHRMAHPRHHVEKVYRVEVRGEVTLQMIRTMETGMVLADGTRLAPVKVHKEGSSREKTTLQLTLVQGVNRQIRRMADDLGLTILKLMRIAQGPIRLGTLPPGKSRELTPEEVRQLKAAAGIGEANS